MYIPKRYGQSRIENCPFCDKIGTIKNSQGVPVCSAHKNALIQDVKCACGEYLDVASGKWGAYFPCLNCGNINFRKGLEMNPDIKPHFETEEKEVVKKAVTKKASTKKTTTKKKVAKKTTSKKESE